MNSPTIGFVGGGRITRVFLEGWARARQLPPDVMVSDPNAEVLSALKSRFPAVHTTPDNALASRQGLVFLAVHPPLIAEVTDLNPVQPLAAMEPQVIEAYRSTLPTIYQKIKP